MDALDCGHPPTLKLGHAYAPIEGTVKMTDQSTWVCGCGEHYLAHGIGTGYARTPDGRKLCYPCADRAQVADMAKADAWMGYHSASGYSVTTWTGGVLAMVTDRWQTRSHPSGGWMQHLRAKAPDGSRWYGKYLRDSTEAVTLHRAKP